MPDVDKQTVTKALVGGVISLQFSLIVALAGWVWQTNATIVSMEEKVDTMYRVVVLKKLEE